MTESESTVAANPSTAAWHPDPFRRFHFRYWDGAQWTNHVVSSGHQSTDPPVAGAPPSPAQAAKALASPLPGGQPSWSAASVPVPTGRWGNNKIQQQVQKAGLAFTAGSSDTTSLEHPALVINQKGKLVELRAEYAIYNQAGLQVAAVRGKRMSSRMEVVDMRGRSLLNLRREASLISAKTVVTGVNGVKVGRIVPSLSLNQVDRTFKLESANNQLIGAVFSEDRQRRREFNVQDTTGTVVAQISKTRAGWAKELFTKGDNYVVNFPGTGSTPLRLLTIATALVIDTAFHQRK